MMFFQPPPMNFDQDVAWWDFVIPDDVCDRICDHHQRLAGMGLTYARNNHGLEKKDEQAYLLEHVEELEQPRGRSVLAPFLERFWPCWEAYCNEYPALQDLGQLQITAMKTQKTLPGEGYHRWHFESDTKGDSIRIAAWTLYLNDVELGGETEWLRQSLRVTPAKGTLCIWPAGYTHVHRGNPPLRGEKYILTGWVEF
jgi:hypothetical protein